MPENVSISGILFAQFTPIKFKQREEHGINLAKLFILINLV